MGDGRCLLVVCLAFWTPAVVTVDQCPMGHVLYTPREGPDTCLPCNPDTYISDNWHTHRSCFDCTTIENPDIERLVRPCNQTHDTVIYCKDGHYWKASSSATTRGQCRQCSNCSFSKRPCDRFADTVCCPGDNYQVVIDKKGVPVCVQLCGPGQFRDSDSDQCLPCPANSYMDQHRHSHIFCLPCQWPKSLAEVVVRACNKTHPAVLDCKVGWFKPPSDSPFFSCARCQRCSQDKKGQIYQARACDRTRDAVCCAGPDMTVVDTADGPACVSPAATTWLSTESPSTTTDTLTVYTEQTLYQNTEAEEGLDESTKKQLDTHHIVIICACALVVVIILGAVIFWMRHRSRKRNKAVKRRQEERFLPLQEA